MQTQRASDLKGSFEENFFSAASGGAARQPGSGLGCKPTPAHSKLRGGINLFLETQNENQQYEVMGFFRKYTNEQTKKKDPKKNEKYMYLCSTLPAAHEISGSLLFFHS